MKKTICLNMIVKNESAVIRRSLDSVKNIIDHWIIVDTGSTDGTQEIIKDHLSAIPGQLHERPWVNFGYNRNEALQLCKDKGDYVLWIDADDQLVFCPDFTLPDLDADLYAIIQKQQHHATYQKHHVYSLVKNSGEFEWEGVIHEYLKTLTRRPKKIEVLQGVYNQYNSDGFRSQSPKKCERDIELLKQDLSNSRNIFYLGRSYYAIKNLDESLKYFRERVMMGGDPLEIYHSLLYIGVIQRQQEEDPEVFLESFMKAHLYRPSRAEAIYEIGRYYTEKGLYAMGYTFSKLALSIPPTSDNLFVESWVTDWGSALQLFTCCHHLGRIDEAKELIEMLIANPHISTDLRKQCFLDQYACYYEKQVVNF